MYYSIFGDRDKATFPMVMPGAHRIVTLVPIKVPLQEDNITSYIKKLFLFYIFIKLPSKTKFILFLFKIIGLSIKVLSCDSKGSWLNPLLDFNLLTLEVSLTQQTFNTSIVLKLGRLFLAQYYKDIIIPLVDTPNEDENQYLLLMKYTLVSIYFIYLLFIQ